ncbi:unnamed protein product [Urochloa humidicola]
MAAGAADGDEAIASALVPSGSGPVPFKDMDDGGTCFVPEHTPSRTEDHGDLVAALPRRQGLIVEIVLYQGCWLPKYWVPGVIEFQRCFNPRPDDVILASYPKSGTTWLMALAFAAAARGAYPPAAREHPLRRLHPHDVVPLVDEVFERGEEARLDALPSPRLMSTHLPFTLLPEPVLAGGRGGCCRVVYVCRDPKDTLVSLWHFLRRSSRPEAGLSFAELFDAVCDGTRHRGARPGLGPRPLLLARERGAPGQGALPQVRGPPAGPGRGRAEAGRVHGPGGRPFSAAEEAAGAVAAVVELCSLGSMKALEVNKAGSVATAGNYLAMPRDSFFRKGVVGGWANHITPEMAARMDGIFREKFLGTGFTFA